MHAQLNLRQTSTLPFTRHKNGSNYVKPNWLQSLGFNNMDTHCNIYLLWHMTQHHCIACVG